MLCYSSKKTRHCVFNETRKVWNDWLLRFNVKKCKHMPVGPHLTLTSYTITDPDNIDHSLSITDCEKDLGVWIASTLHPSVQCQKAYVNPMQSLPLSNVHSSITKIHLISFIKHTSDHILSIASRPGIHIMLRM